jgi:hypothetical protein
MAASPMAHHGLLKPVMPVRVSFARAWCEIFTRLFFHRQNSDFNFAALIPENLIMKICAGEYLTGIHTVGILHQVIDR